jgi:hypothetical protein
VFIAACLKRDLVRIMGRIDLPITLVSAPRVHALNQRAASVATAVFTRKPKLEVAALEHNFVGLRASAGLLRKCYWDVIAHARQVNFRGTNAPSVARITQRRPDKRLFYLRFAYRMSLFGYNG